jgi:GNAT superfamily N-acetyltransferase
VAIERRCFGDPWSEASFREALTSTWTFVLVAQTGRGVAGYLVGRDGAGTGEVLNLAVAPEFRHRGIGDALLQAGLASFRRSQVERSSSKCGSRTPRPGRSIPGTASGRWGSARPTTGTRGKTPWSFGWS